VFPPGYSTFASVEAMRGKIALLRHKRADAVAHLERAVKMYEAAPDRNLLVIRALAMLATAQQAAGDGAAARATAARAVERAREATQGFTHSEWLGSALLAQSEVHRAQGEGEAARAMAAEARAQLEASLGVPTAR
jgi:ATP/maltotriose-dependent transcriptional regulator MalT